MGDINIDATDQVEKDRQRLWTENTLSFLNEAGFGHKPAFAVTIKSNQRCVEFAEAFSAEDVKKMLDMLPNGRLSGLNSRKQCRVTGELPSGVLSIDFKLTAEALSMLPHPELRCPI